MVGQTRILHWASMLLLLLALGLFAGAGSAEAEDENGGVASTKNYGHFDVKDSHVETSVGQIKPFTPDAQDPVAEGDRSTAFAPQCHRQKIIMKYADSKGPYIKFTGIKKWCYDGNRVTQATMDVEPWIRADLSYGPGKDGFVYVPGKLKKSDKYLTYNGHTNGAHKSVRVGRFEYRVHGFPRATQVLLAYVSRIGKYNGACDGPKPKDVSPKVTSVRPANRTQNVSPTANIEASFSASMRTRTLNNNTFSVIRRGSFDPVRASYRYNAESRRAILDPRSKLATGTYTATVSAGPFGILTDEGDPIMGSKSWSFTVK